MHWEARGCLVLGGDGRCLHLTGEGRQGRQETREKGRGWGSGDQALGRGLQNVSSTGSGSQHTCGLAERPPRLPAAARGAGSRRLGCWGLDSARVGFHPSPPRGGVTAASPSALPGAPLHLGRDSSPRGEGCSGDTPEIGAWEGVRGGERLASASSHLGLEAPGRSLPACLLRLPGRRPGCPKTLTWTEWCFTAIC